MLGRDRDENQIKHKLYRADRDLFKSGHRIDAKRSKL
jgi:hypothetical protein